MQTDKTFRVALLGPESTGKTTLCRELAAHYSTVWVPEYARGYVENLNRPYTPDDILHIAERHLENELKMMQLADRLLFIDTELIVSKIWCEDRFGFCPPWIESQIGLNPYDLYLLARPDLPWQPDPVRENPDRRDYFFDLYRSELERRKQRYAVVEGHGNDRFRSALQIVETLLKALAP